MNIINLFSIPVLTTPFLTPTECEKIFTVCKNLQKKCTSHGFLSGTSVSSYSYNTLTNIFNDIRIIPGLADIEERVKNCVNYFSQVTGIGYKDIQNSWFNIQQPGDNLWRHNHTGASIVGAIYINVDEKSSPIVFENPNPYASYIQKIKSTVYNSTFRYVPTIGDIVIFPGYLFHGSDTFTNHTKDRTVISFNTI